MDNKELLTYIFKNEANLDIDADILVTLMEKNFKKEGIDIFEQDIVINKKIYVIKIQYELKKYLKEVFEGGSSTNYILDIKNVSLEPYKHNDISICFNCTLI